jgi:hypothetical protein
MMWTFLIIAIVVLGGGAWWLHQSLDGLVASAIRTYGPQITRVPVKLGAVTVQPTDGSATLQNLELGNPPGFKTPYALAVARISMRLDVASLAKNVIVIHELAIEQPEVVYDYASGGSNLEIIQRNIERTIAERSGPDAPKTPAGEEKKVVIENLTIRGARAKVSAALLQGRAVTVPLADVHLTDIGKKSNGVAPAEAARQVASALTHNVAKATSSLNLGGVVDGVKKGVTSAAKTVKSWFQ